MEIEFNASFGSVLGIDLAKDKMRIARCDFRGNILEKYVGFKIFYQDKELLDKVIKEIEFFLKNDDIDENNRKKDSHLKAICLAVPADVDIETGEIKSASLFEDWEGLNLKEILEMHFNLPIYIENSTNISALGDQYFGEGKKYSEIVFFRGKRRNWRWNNYK